jgi:hypothetical protein
MSFDAKLNNASHARQIIGVQSDYIAMKSASTQKEVRSKRRRRSHSAPLASAAVQSAIKSGSDKVLI